eukprot:tig00000342_g24239.t1
MFGPSVTSSAKRASLQVKSDFPANFDLARDQATRSEPRGRRLDVSLTVATECSAEPLLDVLCDLVSEDPYGNSIEISDPDVGTDPSDSGEQQAAIAAVAASGVLAEKLPDPSRSPEAPPRTVLLLRVQPNVESHFRVSVGGREFPATRLRLRFRLAARAEAAVLDDDH